MKRRVSLTVGRKLKWLAPLVALLLAGVAQAGDLRMIPEEHTGPPIYAKILPWVGYSEWAAVVFYRSPESVPEDSNLWTGRNPELDPDASPILQEGFAIWEKDAVPGDAPYQQVLRDVPGTPVPIWFVNFWELYYDFFRKDRDGDGNPDWVVLIGDFDEMQCVRKGLANSYLDVLQPAATAGGAKVPMVNIVASGVVVEGEGGAFFMQLVYANTDFLTQTTLRFEE